MEFGVDAAYECLGISLMYNEATINEDSENANKNLSELNVSSNLYLLSSCRVRVTAMLRPILKSTTPCYVIRFSLV